MAQLAFHNSLRTSFAPRDVDFTAQGSVHSPEASLDRPKLPTAAEVRSRRNGHTAGTVAFPDLGLFVKFGPSHRVVLEEAQTLQAIRQAFPNNEVPVPELLGWKVEDDINYIYMSLIPGSTLQSCWPSLTLTERTNITDQLAQILTHLRNLRQDPGMEYIGALDHGPVQDIYFNCHTVGPFPSTKEFNDALQFWALSWLPMSQRPPDPFRHLLSDEASICFSHADLHLDNIMVCGAPGSRHIVSIVDWGQAGWYPEFWEYCSMANDAFDHEWATQGWMSRVLKEYNSEFEAVVNYWSWRGPA